MQEFSLPHHFNTKVINWLGSSSFLSSWLWQSSYDKPKPASSELLPISPRSILWSSKDHLLTFSYDDSSHFRRQLFSPSKSGWNEVDIPSLHSHTCPHPVVWGTPPVPGDPTPKREHFCKNRDLNESGEIISAKNSNLLGGLQFTKASSQHKCIQMWNWENGSIFSSTIVLPEIEQFLTLFYITH